MTAALHRDFMDLAISNGLTRARRVRRMLGTRPRPRARSTPTPTSSPASPTTSAPWETCYRTTQLLGGDTKFVLSTSGHIAAHGQPAGQPEGELPDGERATRPTRRSGSTAASKVKGSWWDDYVGVAGRAHRAGAQQAAPPRLAPRSSRCATPRAPMSMTAERDAGRAPSRCAGSPARVSVRPAPARGVSPTSPRSCSATASGPASRRSSRWSTRSTPTVAWSGSTCPGSAAARCPRCPTRSRRCRPGSVAMMAQLGHQRVRRPRPLLGWRAGPAARRAVAAAGPSRRAGRDRHRLPDGAGAPAGAGPDADAAAAPRPGLRRVHRRRDLRRQRCATDPGRGGGAAPRGDARRPEARLLLPARGDDRLDQPAVPVR